MTKETKWQDLVIPNDASKDQIITLLSTIFLNVNKNINTTIR
jgi:hypothetical protein